MLKVMANVVRSIRQAHVVPDSLIASALFMDGWMSQLKAFKVRPFWEFECGAEAGRATLAEAEEALGKERKELDAANHLCALFEFPDLIKESQRVIADMESNCKLMYQVWYALC